MPKRKCLVEAPSERPKNVDDYIVEMADAILKGNAYDARFRITKQDGKSMARHAEEEALRLLTNESEAAQKALYRYNVLRLQLAFGVAIGLGDVGPAVAAIKELNALTNLYAIGAQGAQSLDDEAARMSDNELDQELLRELKRMELHNGGTAIQ